MKRSSSINNIRTLIITSVPNESNRMFLTRRTNADPMQRGGDDFSLKMGFLVR